MVNPYLPPEIPPDADLPEAPRHVADERAPGFWLPIAIAIALVIGLGYYYYGHTSVAPNARADSGAVTKSEPRPN
jgi:hypothetical protein